MCRTESRPIVSIKEVELDGYSCNPVGSVQLEWTKISGPGRVSFANARLASTTATFDKPGAYRLRLTALDGALTAYDETSVFVDGSRDVERPAMQNVVPSTNTRPGAASATTPTDAPGPAELTSLEMTLHATPMSPAGEPDGSRLYLKFDLTHAGRIRAAHLRFMGGIAPDGVAGLVTIGVFAAPDDDWRETQVTTISAPPLGKMIATTTITPDIWRGLSVWHDIDVGKTIKAAIRGHQDFITLCLAPIDASRDFDVTFKSRMATGSEPSLILSGAKPGPVSAQGSHDWVPTFDDEFAGNAIDPAKWMPITHDNDGHWPVHITPANATVGNGVLTLTSTRNADGSYSSAELRSHGRFSQLYGRFEIKAKIGSTAGSWSMADLVPESNGWPPGIDIFGQIGRMPDVVGFTNHWGQSGADDHFDYWLLGRPGFDPAQWHVYAFEWSPTVLRWFVDGQLGVPAPKLRSQSQLSRCSSNWQAWSAVITRAIRRRDHGRKATRSAMCAPFGLPGTMRALQNR